MFTLKTILHPTDFSPHSEYAFWLASLLAHDHGARLVVLHVVQVPIVVYEGMVAPEAPAAAREEARASLDQIRSPISDVKVEHRLEEGDPLTEILRVAKDARCDLIVMGTHGRSGLGRLLMGSVAEAVLRKSPCPVVIVKNPLPFAKAEESRKEPVRQQQRQS